MEHTLSVVRLGIICRLVDKRAGESGETRSTLAAGEALGFAPSRMSRLPHSAGTIGRVVARDRYDTVRWRDDDAVGGRSRLTPVPDPEGAAQERRSPESRLAVECLGGHLTCAPTGLLPIMDRQLGKLGNVDQGPLSWLLIVVSATDDSDDACIGVYGWTATCAREDRRVEREHNGAEF